MVRTQIYLTEIEHKSLLDMAVKSRRKQSELIREAVDRFIVQFRGTRREAVVSRTAGMWKDRTDLPVFARLRKTWNRLLLCRS